MFRPFARLLVLIAAAQVLGGHWVLLQSVAWVGMVAEYSHNASVTDALKKTFDGQHPCELCRAVKRGQDGEQQKQIAKMLLKVEAVLTQTWELPPRSTSVVAYLISREDLAQRFVLPPVPPPLA